MLENLWYVVIIVSLMCYAMLDGFDLGVGALHLFVKKEEERRVFLNAIGPVWDGNEVWLVVVVGALFAGFPNVYATLLSTFYNLMMVVIAGLIFRAVAIEFRSKLAHARWRLVWDRVFGVASVIIGFGVGLVLGNLIQGIQLDQNGDFVGNFSDFFTPYPLLVGMTTLALFMMHGSIFLVMKTEGTLHSQLRRWVYNTLIFFILCYLIATAVTFMRMPHMLAAFQKFPALLCIPFLACVTMGNLFLQVRKRNDGWAFISSCICIALLLSLFALGTYPTLIRSSLSPETNSLEVFNSASSPLTLKVLLVIVLLGVPLVLGYGFYIYRIFRGKVKIDKNSY